MEPLPTHKKERGLTQESFDILLKHLDPDRDCAGKMYEKIRLKLIVFFECRGFWRADDHADEALNRLARRYSEGEVIKEPTPYAIGIARMMIPEIIRADERERLVLNQFSKSQPVQEDDAEHDLRAECCEGCLEKLSDEDRNIIIEYYQGEKHEKIKNRKKMAERMNISMNSLRIYTYRIRTRIEECIEDCMKENPPE